MTFKRGWGSRKEGEGGQGKGGLALKKQSTPKGLNQGGMPKKHS